MVVVIFLIIALVAFIAAAAGANVRFNLIAIGLAFMVLAQLAGTLTL
jgi:hypothetical protein